MSNRPGSDEAPRTGDRRSLFSLVRDLSEDLARLLRQEITLARIELLENARSLARNGVWTAAGGAIALLGLLVFVEFMIIGLGALLGGIYWLSALLISLALVALGVGAAYLGVRRMGRASIAPASSLESAKQTGDWLASEAEGLRKSLRGSRSGAAAGSGARSGPAERIGTAEPRLDPLALRVSPSSPPADERTLGPGEISAAQSFVRRVFEGVMGDDVLGQGAKVAFFMFTSVPPALLVVFGLSGIFGGVELAESLTSRVETLLAGSADDPNSAAALVSNFIHDVVATRAPGPLSIGLLLGLWAASAVFVALTEALNRAFDVSDERSWVHRRALAILVMIVFALLFLGASAMLLAGPLLADAIGLAGGADLAWSVLQWPLSFLLVVAAFFLIYYALPNHDLSGAMPMLLKASAIAAAMWVLVTLGFRIYVANFASYGETYGFVGGVLVLLLWTYLTSIVILIGGEVAAELERTG